MSPQAGVVNVWERLTGGRIFYGWSIVGIAFSASMITAGISGYGLSFFLIPMSEELGVSRAEFSTITLFRLASLPVIPLLGLLVDKKHGPRMLLTFGSILAGLTLIAKSRSRPCGSSSSSLASCSASRFSRWVDNSLARPFSRSGSSSGVAG